MDYDCLNCGEPWDVGLEPDAPRQEVERWLGREYGRGFELSDCLGEWLIERCPCCPMKHCCQTCYAMWEAQAEKDENVEAVQQCLEHKYGDGFAVGSVGGAWVIELCPLCEYLPDEHRWPLFAWAGLPFPG